MAKRKKINPRVLLVVCVLGVILAGFIVAVIIQRLPKDPTADLQIVDSELKKEHPDWTIVFKHLQRARSNTEDKQKAADLLYREAELHFEALRREPNLTRVQKDEHRRGGWQTLEQVLRKDNRHLKARQSLSELYQAVAQSNPKSRKAWQDYISQLDGLLGVDAKNAQTYFRRAGAYAQLSSIDPQYQQKAIDDFHKAIELDKTRVEYQDFLSRYLLAIGRSTEAEKTLREAIQAHPKKAQLRISYARLLRQQKRLEEAGKQIEEAIRCEPTSPLGYLEKSREYLMQKKFDQAEDLLKKARKIADTDIRVYGQFLLLYRMKRDRQAAVNVLREGLAALAEEDAKAKDDDKIGARRRSQIRASLNYMLADVLLDVYTGTKDEKEREKLLAEAKERYQILVTLSPSQIQKDMIAGRIAYFEKDWVKARSLLENVVGHDSSSRVAIYLLDIYSRLGIPGQSEKLAERVLQMPNLTPQGRLLFTLQLVRLRMSAREYDKAQKLLETATRIDADNEDVKNLKKALAAAQGETKGLLSGEKRSDRMTRAMLFRRVQDLILDEQYEEAKSDLEILLRQNPADLQALTRMAALLMEQEKRDEALEWVAKAKRKEPENERLTRLEAIIKEPSTEKRYEIELGFVDQLKTDDPLIKALQKWNIAARYGKTKEAKAYLDEAEKIDPNNNAVISIRFREAILNKDWTAGEELIERIKEDETGTMRGLQHARLAMARGQAEKKEGNAEQADAMFTKALSYLESVVKAAPHLPVPHLLMAECYKELNQNEKAKKQYRICYDNNNQNLQAMIGLARLAQQAEQPQEFQRWIREAYKLSSGKVDPYVLEQHLELLEADPRNTREVILQRERLLKRNPNNLSNAFRLAVLYEKTEQMNRAQEMIEYIYQRTPRKLSIAPMLANLYLRMKRPAKADEMFSGLLKNAKTKEQKVLTRIAYADFLAQSDEAAALRMYEKAKAEEGDKGTQALLALSNFRAAQAVQETAKGQKNQAAVRWNESIDLLKQACSVDPSNRPIQLILLRRYIDSDQYDKAIAGFQDMIRKNPDDIEARIGLGTTYLQVDDLEKAKEQFDEIVRIDPDQAEAYLLRSRVYQSQMDLAKAAADINTAATLTGNISLRMNLAQVYEAMGDTEQAAQTYATMIDQNPEDFAAYAKLLNLFYKEKRWSALDDLARKGMKVFPGSPEFALNLARAAESQTNTKDQLHWLDRAAQIAPDNPGVVRRYWMTLLNHLEYATLQREVKKYGNRPSQAFGAAAIMIASRAKQNPAAAKPFQELVSMFKSAPSPRDVFFVGQLIKEAYGPGKIIETAPEICKIRPKDKNVYLIVGNACLQEKQYPKAEQYYQEALKLCTHPREKASLRLQLAQSYTAEGNYPKVEEQYTAILQENSNNIIALNNLAYTYIDHLNRPEEGLKLIQRAMKITPGDPNLVDTYAWALAKLGRLNEAREMYEKVIGIGDAAESADRLYHLGYVLEKTGSDKEAGRYYRQALEIARAKKNTDLQKTIEAAMANIDKK